MQTALLDVLDFHKKMGLSIGDPRKPDLTVDTQLRWDLIHEEFDELTLALQGKDKHGETLSPQEQIIAVADALGDIAYVVAGAAATWGIDLAGVFSAIHDSNMTKTPGNKRADGKILKGPDYVPPDIEGALENARCECLEHGFGDDCWWPRPTSSTYPTDRKAKTQAAMKSIKEDMFPEEIKDFGKNQMPPEMTELCYNRAVTKDLDEPRDSDPTPLERQAYINNFMSGYFTSHDYIFECSCKRTQTVPIKLGSRGGWADSGECSCICGLQYSFTFEQIKMKDPIAKGTVKDLNVLNS